MTDRFVCSRLRTANRGLSEEGKLSWERMTVRADGEVEAQMSGKS